MNSYSRSCSWNLRKQPVILTDKEKEKIEKDRLKQEEKIEKDYIRFESFLFNSKSRKINDNLLVVVLIYYRSK